MEVKKKIKLLQWAVIALVLLNLAVIGFIWMRPGQNGYLPKPHDGGPGAFIIKELGFNNDQIKKFEELKLRHRTSMRELMDKGRGYRDELFELLKKDVNQTEEINRWSDSIARNQKEIELITFDHFSAVRAICNEQQKHKFDEIINDVLHKMAMPHRANQGPPENRKGPPPIEERP